MQEGEVCTRAGRSKSQVLKRLAANLSSVLLEKPTLRISVKIHLISLCHGPPATGVQLLSLWIRSSVQGSAPGRSPLTTSLPKSAQLWQAGSTIPRPPSAVGNVMTRHATLALTGPPSLPDHKKFLISLCIWLMQELEKIQQEVIYHIVAKRTWLATTTRPTKESLLSSNVEASS